MLSRVRSRPVGRIILGRFPIVLDHHAGHVLRQPKSACISGNRCVRLCSSSSGEAKSGFRRYLNATYFVHTGNLLLLLAVNQTDMLWLRCLMIVASACGVCFNLLQPTPLYAPAVWGGFFITCHFYRLALLYRERLDLILNSTEQELWDSTFHMMLTKVQMRDLFRVGYQQEYRKGDVIAKAGAPSSYQLLIVVRGEVRVEDSTGRRLATVRPGEFLNEFRYLRERDHWDEPVTTKFIGDENSVFRWDTRVLRDYLKSRPDIWTKLEGLFAIKMATQLEQFGSNASVTGYIHVLKGVLSSDTVSEKEVSYLNYFRDTRKITASEHTAALWELGYSETEFEALVIRTRSSEHYVVYKNVLQGILADGIIHEKELAHLDQLRASHEITHAQHLDALEELGFSESEYERLASVAQSDNFDESRQFLQSPPRLAIPAVS